MRRGFQEPADKPRRFYKAVSVEPVADGFEVRLDARTVRTPKGGRLALPTRALADQVAEEWASQGETLEVAAMHVTRLANTALEAIPAARHETAVQVAQYAGSDLVCYFAEGPSELVERQGVAWNPVLEWVEVELGARLVRVSGIIHQSQPSETLEAIEALARSLDDFRLAALAFGSALFGSTVLALAVLKGRLSGEEAFALSRIDESFQEEKWGVDAEAAERTERLRVEAAMLERWFRALER